ncbi:MAG TPA: energy transducer TonB [Candidatus Rubrimentiphilum sp.]|nr:energy transducer TonB [Candidatus Rubrimentiphilum sp.]
MNGRALLAALACILLGMLAHGKAAASVFCDADIVGVASLDAVRPENPRVAQPRLALILGSNDAGTLNGDVILLTPDAAYNVHFENVVAAKSQSAGQPNITKPLLIGFSQPLNVTYAWVDDIGMNGAAPHACPTNPFDAVFGNGNLAPIPFPSVPAALNLINVIPATFKMNLPPTDCATPYRRARQTKSGPKETDYFDTSQGLKAKLLLRVSLDSDGKVADVRVTQSSGSAAVDTAAVVSASKAQYAPAIFRCVPVVGTVDIDFGYEVVP